MVRVSLAARPLALRGTYEIRDVTLADGIHLRSGHVARELVVVGVRDLALICVAVTVQRYWPAESTRFVPHIILVNLSSDLILAVHRDLFNVYAMIII